MDLVTVYDCIGSNVGKFPVPDGVLMAGYATGTHGVPWSDAEFAQHPGAVVFDQSPTDTPADETADVLDVEPYAATIADVPIWVHAAWTSYRAGRRPGQRTPTVYVEESELTPVANTLNASGITDGVNLWLSSPMSAAAAEHMVETASGPFPIVGVQYDFGPEFDVSVVSKAWLDNVSKPPVISHLHSTYEAQMEYWKPGFGWVLFDQFTFPAMPKVRIRISDRQWREWKEIYP